MKVSAAMSSLWQYRRRAGGAGQQAARRGQAGVEGELAPIDELRIHVEAVRAQREGSRGSAARSPDVPADH